MHTSAQVRAHSRLIDSVVADAAAKAGVVIDKAPSPLQAMLDYETRQEPDEYAIKAEAVAALLNWLFEGGPSPKVVLSRLYAYVRPVRPELLLNMSGSQIAALLGETRAAESHRVRLILGETLVKAGNKCTQFAYQKSTTAIEKSRRAATGNRVRARSVEAA